MAGQPNIEELDARTGHRGRRAVRLPAVPRRKIRSLIFFTSLESAVGTYKQKTLARVLFSRSLTAKALQTRAVASLTFSSWVIAQANGPQLDVRGRFEGRSGADRADFGGLSEEPETADWTRGPPIRELPDLRERSEGGTGDRRGPSRELPEPGRQPTHRLQKCRGPASRPRPSGRTLQLPGAAIRSSLPPAARPFGSHAGRSSRAAPLPGPDWHARRPGPGPPVAPSGHGHQLDGAATTGTASRTCHAGAAGRDEIPRNRICRNFVLSGVP